MNSVEHNGEGFDRNVLLAYAVPDTPAGLENRLIEALRDQGLIPGEKTPGSRRSRIAAGVFLAVVAAVVVVVLLVRLGDRGGDQIMIERVTTPSTIRISDRAVALVEPGAELGYRVEDDGSVRVVQRLGIVTYRVEGVVMDVETPGGKVSVQGTCFRVEVDEVSSGEVAPTETLSVAVHAGTVVVENSGERLILEEGGRGAVRSAGAAPVPVDGTHPGPCPIGDELFAAGGADGQSPGPAPASAGKTGKPQADHKPGEPPDPEGSLVLEGQVLDPEGLQAEGALVVLDARPVRKTVTGKDGSFSFDRLIPRLCRLAARRGNQYGGGYVSHFLSADSGPVVIRLRTAARLRVEVLEAESDHPVSGAKVEIGAFDKRTAVTGPSGSVQFEGVGGGVRLTVRARGFVTVSQLFSVPEASELPIVVKMMLRRGIGLSGRIVDAQGAGVAGALVRLFILTEVTSSPLSNPSTSSDNQGRYSFEAVAPGTYRLAAIHDDYAPGTAGPVEVGGRKPFRGVDIVMGAAAQIRGRVVDQNGEPVGWAMIRYSPPIESSKALAWVMGGSAIGHRYADGQGRFEIGGLPREKLGLVAVGEASFSEELAVDLKTNPYIEAIELMLKPGARISGTVVDGKDNPQAEATVVATGDFADGTHTRAMALRGGVIFYAFSDGAGKFELKGLVKGTYELQATRLSGRIDWAQEHVKAHTGDEDVRLVITEYGGIKGRVQFADGTRPKRFVLGLGLGWEPGVPFEPMDGRFEIDNVAPASYDITIQGNEFALLTLPGVKVEPGETKDLGNVVVNRGRRIGGKVVDGEGKPVSGSEVLYGQFLVGDGSRLQNPGVLATHQQGKLSTISGPMGLFEIKEVCPEAGVVAAEHARLGRSMPVKIPKGTQDSEVVLVVRETGSISGQVRRDGEPESAALVEVRPRDMDLAGQQLTVTTDANGKYLLSRVAAGEHAVSVRRRMDLPYSPHVRKNVEIRPGERAVVDFDLQTGEIELRMDIRGLQGAQVDAARIWLIQGSVQVGTIAEIRQYMMNNPMVFHFDLCKTGTPCTISNITPGDYTLCAFPYTGNINEGDYMDRVHEQWRAMPAYCNPIRIPSEPKKQSHTLDLPAMKPLSEER